MRLKIHYPQKLLEILDADDREIKQVNKSFTRQIEGWNFKKGKIKGGWDGWVSFVYKDRFIPFGLWRELIEVGKKFDFEVTFENSSSLKPLNIDFEEFREWSIELFNGHKITPYEYQIKAAWNIIRWKHSMSEMATSSGKSLILFLVYAYLRNRVLEPQDKVLVIVPNISLVDQLSDDFEIDYNKNNVTSINIQPIYSGRKIKENANLVIGTYQSLVKEEGDFFKDFSVVMVDEAHTGKSYSVKTVLEKLYHCEWRFGVTGTTPKKDSLDHLQVTSVTGPLVNKVTASELQDENYIAKCNINIIRMRYCTNEFAQKLHNLSSAGEDGKTILNLEKKWIVESKWRVDVITKIVKKDKKNQLVLFQGVESNYGKTLAQSIKEKTDHDVYYIDGSTPMEKRDFIIKEMKEGTNKVLCASYGVFSTGLSIKNLHAIHLTESYKSDVIIRQSIGRGLRLHHQKDSVIIYDYVDDIRHHYPNGSWKNKLWNHGLSRIEIYKEQKFPYKIVEINKT